MQLMLGAKQYVDTVLYHHYHGTEEKELVFDFEPISIYYKGKIRIKYYSGFGYFPSSMSVKITLYPLGGETPTSWVDVVYKSELSRHIEKITGKTLSF